MNINSKCIKKEINYELINQAQILIKQFFENSIKRELGL